jgi:hypothetical protein
MAGQEKASSDVFALIARDLQVFRGVGAWLLI